jgi:hypothetical protein
MTKHVYRSNAAEKIHNRPQKGKPERPAARVGQGKHAHPQPRGPQERKGKR